MVPGETNVGKPDNYKTLFPLMIKNWRDNWGEGDFPFYFVQIAPFDYGNSSRSYIIREAQFLTLSLPNTGMAVTLDIATVKNIHPPDKQDVGKRLALWALAKNYNKKITYSGPLYKSIKIEKNKAVLSFEEAGTGLIFKESSGETNFLIAGKDKKFVKAKVKVDGKKFNCYPARKLNNLQRSGMNGTMMAKRHYSIKSNFLLLLLKQIIGMIDILFNRFFDFLKIYNHASDGLTK